MRRQIRFFLCEAMQTAIEAEGRRIGAILVSTSPHDRNAIQFSTSAGIDRQQGRLWTEAENARHYKALCRAVKKDSVFNRHAGLWVKRASREAFHAYRVERQRVSAELVERNRKYAVEVLGGRVSDEKG